MGYLERGFKEGGFYVNSYEVFFVDLEPGKRHTMPDIAQVRERTDSPEKTADNSTFISKSILLASKDIFSNPKTPLFTIAACYDLGHETEKNMVEAKRFYRMAYVQRLLDSNQICLQNLPSIHTLLPGWYGFILPDTPEAYKDAAELEYPIATFLLGMCYLNGRGVSENDNIANKYFETARKLGSTDGTKALANSYLRGYGVTKDENRAVELFKESYDNGDQEGGLNYGFCLFNTGHRTEGIAVVKKLAAEGYAPAIEALKNIPR